MIISLLFSLFSSAQAVPLQLTQQGRILDSNSVAVTGTQDLTFRIYDSSTGGNLLWWETLTVNFTNGYYAAVLGADEQTNPLDSTTLALYPLYLEIQLSSNSPMTTRYAINSAPYAQMAEIAEIAESVDGGLVNASELQINSSQVIDGSGNWVGQPITVGWNDIDPSTIPLDLADGDDDSLGALSCSIGEIIAWSGSVWVCTSDSTLSVSDLEIMLANNPMDLNSATTIGGLAIVTELDDSDTLAALSCANDGEIARYDIVSNSWYCDADADTLANLACQDGEMISYDTAAASWVCIGTASSGSGSVANGFQTIPRASGITVNSNQGAPVTVLQGLIDDGTYIEQVQPSRHVECIECGTGADGNYNPGSFSSQLVLTSGEYNFVDFNLPAGVTLYAPGSDTLVIRATGSVDIYGTIDLSGENGGEAQSGVSIGLGGAGGGAGATDGGDGNSSYGGAGSDGTGGSTNVSLASTDLTGLTAGAGGTGGRSGNTYYLGSGGGGGGGSIVIIANNIRIDGEILVDGGARGTVNMAGGHGGSGVIWLRAPEVRIAGSLSSYSPCSSCRGEIRIDSHNIIYPSTDYVAGTAADLPQEYSLYQDNTGIIYFENNSTNSINFDLRYIP